MKTVVEKLRTIVSLEYKFDDNSEGCQVPGLLVDDWAEVMTLLWQAYFGDILEYEDVVDVIMACKAEGMDQEQVVAKLLDYYADWVLEDYQYEKYAAERDEAERKLYREVLAKNSEKLGLFIDELLLTQQKGNREK